MTDKPTVTPLTEAGRALLTEYAHYDDCSYSGKPSAERDPGCFDRDADLVGRITAIEAEAALPVPTPAETGLLRVRADIEYRLTVGLMHVPGATEREERHYNDGQAFGLRYALDRIDAALSKEETPMTDLANNARDVVYELRHRKPDVTDEMIADVLERAIEAEVATPAPAGRPFDVKLDLDGDQIHRLLADLGHFANGCPTPAETGLRHRWGPSGMEADPNGLWLRLGVPVTALSKEEK